MQYKPSKPGDIERVHSMGNKMLDGVFVGYSQSAGGDWNGDYFVVDMKEMSDASISTKHQPAADHPRGCITLRRIKEVKPILREEGPPFIVPYKDPRGPPQPNAASSDFKVN